MVDTDSGYYEIYVPVWDPNEEGNISNLVVGVYADSDVLNDINSQLEQNIQRYSGEADVDEQSQLEAVFQGHLSEMLRRGVVKDMYCPEHDISSVEDFEKAREAGQIELFPL